ncbi:type II secretion system inner membrane protein GspF [Isoalcanivorax indicus]|uniref:type II secretion system inner membrane protein GspF n=1 Tax=Isoalcanivorax indicus TaxID=2202653 RepID=UPI000DBA91F0|nr:type II secretion system inner membrane protein GspF [Isoalcanivorax indicus]
MPAFEFRSLDARGKVRKGMQEGDSARQVRQALRDKGWVPLEVREARDRKGGATLFSSLSRAGRLNTAEQALITRQLATLIRSGLPIEQALSAVARQAGRPHIERIVLAVRAKVTEGYSLARSMAEFPRAFPEMYRATVAAGEQSGHLEQVLEQLAEYLENRHDTGRSVMQSMIYPAFILVFSIVIITLMMTYVVPRMVEVFARNEEGLPALTRVMIVISDFFRDWLWLAVLLIIGGVVAFVQALKSPSFRMRVHQRLARMPLIGKLICTADSSRLASTLGILSRSGVPLVEALAISSQVVGNLAVREAVKQAASKVREGGNLSRALDASGYFPPMLVQMIASGEASGELDRMLSRAAEYQERELAGVVSTVVGLLGPAMLLTMASLVFLIVLAMMQPIMQMNALFAM